MVDAASHTHVHAHPVRAAGSAAANPTLRLDPPPRPQPLWRFALVGLGPLGGMCLIAGGVAIGHLLGW